MSTLNDEDRENLAAFLDGELDEHASQALEAKLNRDPEARKEVDALRQAWSMLDFLPRPEPSPNFTHRTMERLTMAVPRAVPTAKVPTLRPARWLLGLVWASAVLLALSLGAVAGSFIWQPPDPFAAVLAQHGHLIDHLTLYEQIVDLDFLKSLDQPELFAEEPSFEEPEHQKPWKSSVSSARRHALARVFLDLPVERREQLVKLDQDLRAEPETVRDRLLAAAHRYKVWFDHLGVKEKEKVTSEPDRKKQFVTIGKLRKLTRSWDLAVRFWDERNSMFSRMKDLPKDVQEYYDEYLKHMITAEEKDRLSKADNQWPLFVQMLVELADKHPPALRGPEGVKKFAELPKKVKEELKGKTGKMLKAKEGWPIFAVAVSKLAFANSVILPNELWPTKEECLNPPMRTFLKVKLVPVLTGPELRKYTNAIGNWPDYPEAIQELAVAHKLHPPWFTLPGPRERWDVYRLPKSDSSDGPR